MLTTIKLYVGPTPYSHHVLWYFPPLSVASALQSDTEPAISCISLSFHLNCDFSGSNWRYRIHLDVSISVLCLIDHSFIKFCSIPSFTYYFSPKWSFLIFWSPIILSLAPSFSVCSGTLTLLVNNPRLCLISTRMWAGRQDFGFSYLWTESLMHKYSINICCLIGTKAR